MPASNSALALATIPVVEPFAAVPTAHRDVHSPVAALLIERLERVDTQISRLSEAPAGGEAREDAMLAMIARTVETLSDAEDRLVDVLSSVATTLTASPAPAAAHSAAFIAVPAKTQAVAPRPNAAPTGREPDLAPSRFFVDFERLNAAASCNSRTMAANGGPTEPAPLLNE